MSKSGRILTLDIGASKLVLAEFMLGRTGAPELINYGVGQLGVEPEAETDPSAYQVAAIRDIMRDHGIRPAPLLMSVSGQAVFPRYVKLPAVNRDKLFQMVRYEAEQNVPFPIHEVVWDYQFMGTGPEGDMNVMLVAAKTDIISRLTDCVAAAGLEPEVVDVATMALYNIVRFNYPDLQGCTMILDMGARTSNLIFVEESRIFSRSITVAGNAITQELMKEFELPFKDAEEMKRVHAFVAFGGVTAGPEGEVADRVSKIVRNVVTRLHAEVNRSINFYRSQQGGNAPSLVLLTGGSSVIPHADTFFREKLKVQVEYLNPFVNVGVGGKIDSDRIAGDLHLLGEVAGLALRRSLKCPVEINLMPPELVSKKVFRKRQPFFALAALGLVLALLCWCVSFFRMNGMLTDEVKRIQAETEGLRSVSSKLEAVRGEKDDVRKRTEDIAGVVSARTRWVDILDAIHGRLLDGMWLTGVKPLIGEKDGMMTKLEIKTSGFEDKLKRAETNGMTPGEVFSHGLLDVPLFETNSITSITKDPNAYSSDYTLEIVLKQPVKVGPMQ